MIVDASAVLAVILREADARLFENRLWAEGRHRMSAVNYLEAVVRIDRLKVPELSGELDRLFETAEIDIVAATAMHARLAREAYGRYGKGNHHAGLNLGDCFAYALAKATGEPLLFKGDDFARTDIQSAL